MAYTITLSNGSTLPVVLDGVTDTTSTSITLIGKNYVGYGAFLNQNFVKLLENFSNATAPAHPVTGQLWWSTDQKTLSVFTGAGWKALASSTVGSVTPTAPVTGDQWFDTTVGQLKAWNGSNWVIIGPGFTTGQGISGAIAETVIDSLGASHVVVKFYISGTVSAILSKDATFTPAMAILGFNAGIKPGFNLAAVGNFLYYNDAYNALNLGGTAAANYARTDIATTFNSTVSVSNNAGLTVGSSVGGDFSAAVTSSAVNLKSVTVGKSLNLIAAGQSGPALSVASGTGLVTVAADPVAALGVATKQYVDNATAVAISGSATVLKRDGTNTVTGIITPDVTATRDLGTTSLRFAKLYATGINSAGVIESTIGGIKYPDGTVQTTAATSAAVGSVTPDRLSAGGPYWLGNGNLGVGTTTPGYKLDVSDTARINNGLVLVGGAGSAYIYSDANTNNFIVRSGPSSAYRYTSIDANGSLSVQGSINGGTITGTYSGSQGFVDQDITKAAFYTEIAQAGSSYVPALKIRTGGAARIRFASFGALHNTDGTVDTVIHALDSTDANNYFWRFTNGGAFISPGDVTAFSDITLKKDVETISDALDKVSALRGVGFTRIDTEAKSIGVIAQEVEKIIPEVVHTDASGIKSVAYGNLVGLLIEAVKELKSEVESLKKELGKK